MFLLCSKLCQHNLPTPIWKCQQLQSQLLSFNSWSWTTPVRMSTPLGRTKIRRFTLLKSLEATLLSVQCVRVQEQVNYQASSLGIDCNFSNCRVLLHHCSEYQHADRRADIYLLYCNEEKGVGVSSCDRVQFEFP